VPAVDDARERRGCRLRGRLVTVDDGRDDVQASATGPVGQRAAQRGVGPWTVPPPVNCGARVEP
jgi:hypothetical protein